MSHKHFDVSMRLCRRAAVGASAAASLTFAAMTSAGTAEIQFNPLPPVTVGVSPLDLVAADLDGDTVNDIATADYGPPAGGTASVLINNGGGALTSQTPLTVGAARLLAIDAVMNDATGLWDLFVARESLPLLQFENNGARGAGPEFFARDDAIGAGASLVGGGGFIPGETSAVVGIGDSLLPLDEGFIASRIGDGNGGFPGEDTWEAYEGAPAALVIASVDDLFDSKLDVIISGGVAQGVSIRLTDSYVREPCEPDPFRAPGCPNGFSPRGIAPHSIIDLPGLTQGDAGAIAAADLLNTSRGAAHVDFTLAEASLGLIHLFEGNGLGGFTPEGTLGAPSNVVDLATADFDGDGLTDLAAAGFASAEFMPIGTLPGDEGGRSEAHAISGDGSTVVGLSSPGGGLRAFRWRQDIGMQALATNPGDVRGGWALDASHDGSVIVGLATPDSGTGSEGFRWTLATGMLGMGPTSNAALGVSMDGSVATGNLKYRNMADTADIFEAFRWTQATGPLGIGMGVPQVSSFGLDISGNGAVVVGSSSFQIGPSVISQAYRWQNNVFNPLGSLAPNSISTALAISSDASLIVGRSIAPGGGFRPFLWRSSTMMMENLGALDPGHAFAAANEVAESGGVITVVGESGAGDATSDRRAFIWTSDGGLRDLREYLLERGAAGAQGWTLLEANGISLDRSAIVGIGVSPEGRTEAWLARLDVKPTQSVVVVYRNRGDGGFEAVAATHVPDEVTGLIAAELTGDLLPDLAVTTRDGPTDPGAVTVIRNETASPCPADQNGDGVVNSSDLAQLLASWGACKPSPALCAADLTDDGIVNSSDLAQLLASWGACD